MMSGKWLSVGKLVNTHGIRGDVKIWPSTDFPELRFAPGRFLTLHAPDSDDTLEVEIISSREQKGMYVLKLKGFDNINQVERYKGWAVKVPDSELAELDEDEYYYHQIIGCNVLTESGDEIGVISEILQPGANDVWVVNRPKGKQALIPFIKDVVLQVDVKEKRVTIRPMEGLLE